MKGVRKLSFAPAAISLLLGCLVISGVLVMWRSGALEFLELDVYDRMVRRQTPSKAVTDQVVIVGITDHDIVRWKYGWPLTDKILAELLEKIQSAHPSAVGVDLYRDSPVPASGEHLPQLDATLKRHPNQVFIHSINAGTQPPPALADKPEQLGFNDVPSGEAINAIIRRGLFYMWHDQENATSFGLQLAQMHLAKAGIVPEPDPSRPEFLRLGKTTFHPFEPHDGPFVKADAGGYQFLLDYKGPREFPVYSLRSILAGGVPEEAFRDKIVLVGITARTVKDFVNTPLQSEQHGIELHAHIVNQILRAAQAGEKPLGFWKEWQEGAWIISWGLVGAALGYHLRSPFRLSLALTICAIALWFAFSLSFGAGRWIPFVTPAVACFPCAAMVTSFMSHQEKNQRDLLMHLFSRHVSKDIAENVWEQRHLFVDGDRPRPQKLVATVLFTDLKGFSATSEKMDPALLIDWLNQYMDVMAQVVVRHGGVINKYIGDAIMATFGIPLPRATREEMSRDAVNAVRSALEMGQELAKLNARWQGEKRPTTSMRVGIFTGPLVAGSIGSSDRLEYTVIGDTVNTASRLESFDSKVADPDQLETRCRVLIGEPTFELLEGEFETKLIGTLSVKGKMEKITMYQVLAAAEPPSAPREVQLPVVETQPQPQTLNAKT